MSGRRALKRNINNTNPKQGHNQPGKTEESLRKSVKQVLLAPSEASEIF